MPEVSYGRGEAGAGDHGFVDGATDVVVRDHAQAVSPKQGGWEELGRCVVAAP
jgi:hypothetical protein